MTITLELTAEVIGKTLAAAFANATGATGKWNCIFHAKDGNFTGATLTLAEYATPKATP